MPQEPSYNVFISYKATDNSQPTKDAEIAEALYKQLSVLKGIRPFWDRRELENSEGQSDFGKSIYAALESAKIFVFVCTKASYLQTSYVESEWSTYLTELNGGRKPGGSIYGITLNVSYEEIPIGLRKFETLQYSEANLEYIVSIIEKRLQGYSKNEHESPLQQWKQQRMELILSKVVFSDFNVRQFVDTFLGQAEKNAACITLGADYENNTSLTAEAVRLSADYDVYYFFTFEEACLELQNATGYGDFGDEKKTLVFIEEPLSGIKLRRAVNTLLKHGGKSVFQTRDTLLPVEKSKLFYTTVNALDEYELLATLKAICQEKAVPCVNQFLDMLRLPIHKALIKPSYITLMVEYLAGAKEASLDDSNSNLFDVLDNAIACMDSDASAMLDLMTDEYLNKRINLYQEKSYVQYQASIRQLEIHGILKLHMGRLSVKVEDYLYYKAAKQVLLEQGDLGQRFLKRSGLTVCIPMFVYLCSLYYGGFQEDLFSDTDGKDILNCYGRQLLLLFINSGSFSQIATLIDDEAVLSEMLFELVSDGQYELVHGALRQLEDSCGSYKNTSWDNILHMVLEYYRHGRYRDCNCPDNIWYWIYKGTILYYLDDYGNAVSSLMQALQMAGTKSQTVQIILMLSDILVDSGQTDLLNEVLNKYHELFDIIIDNIHFLIFKGNISFSHGEMSDAKEYYREARDKLKTHFNSASIARTYGNLGLVEYYLGNTRQAIELFAQNEDICIDTDNTNGIAISRTYLGQAYLYQHDLNTAYKYFSAAMFYAVKAQNQWRITQISMLVDHFRADFKDRVQAHITEIERIPSLVYHAEMLLSLAECMLRTACKKEAIIAVLEKCRTVSDEISSFYGVIAAYYLDLLEGGESVVPPYLSGYCAYARQLCAKYADGETIVKDPSASVLPFVRFRELSTERLQFCHVAKEHAAGIFRYASRIQPTKYVLWPRHESIFTTMNFIENMLRNEAKYDDYMSWIIIEKDSGNVIGMADLAYNENYQGVEIGIILSDFYWQRGFGTETVTRLSGFARDDLELKELYGVCVKGNKASEAMLRKCGFEFVKEIPDYHNIDFLPNRSALMFKKLL